MISSLDFFVASYEENPLKNDETIALAWPIPDCWLKLVIDAWLIIG